MKFLSICEGGNNRSGAMSLQLKLQGHDTIQAGWRFNTVETLDMLMEWADYVVLMQAEFLDRLKERGCKIPQHKIRIVDVGPDVWGSNTHMGLNLSLEEVVLEWKAKEWKI